MATRLEILEASRNKKVDRFNTMLSSHIADVKRANGQPLNDKRNGSATLNRWNRQDDALRNAKKEIKKTEDAIENEKWRQKRNIIIKEGLPDCILDMMEQGLIKQWNKYPSTFFVVGVNKARLVWDGQVLSYKYLSSITDKDQYRLFAQTYNKLNISLAQK